MDYVIIFYLSCTLQSIAHNTSIRKKTTHTGDQELGGATNKTRQVRGCISGF